MLIWAINAEIFALLKLTVHFGWNIKRKWIMSSKAPVIWGFMYNTDFLNSMRRNKISVERAKQLTGIIGVFIRRYEWVCFFKIMTHSVFNCAVKTISLSGKLHGIPSNYISRFITCTFHPNHQTQKLISVVSFFSKLHCTLICLNLLHRNRTHDFGL